MLIWRHCSDSDTVIQCSQWGRGPRVPTKPQHKYFTDYETCPLTRKMKNSTVFESQLTKIRGGVTEEGEEVMAIINDVFCDKRYLIVM